MFFRPGKFAEFDQLLKSDPENLRLASLLINILMTYVDAKDRGCAKMFRQ